MRKQLTAFLFLLLVSSVTFLSCTKENENDEENSTASWQQVASLPGTGRSRAFSFSIGDYIYVGMGEKRNNGVAEFLTDFYSYNAVTNTWKALGNLPFTQFFEPRGFSLNGKGYIIGIQTDSCNCGLSLPLKDVWEFDPTGSTWKKVATLSQADPQSGISGVFASADKAYILVGRSELWEFNPANHSFVTKADCPIPLLYPTSFSVNNKGYVMPGNANDDGSGGKAILEYNPDNNQWTRKADFPGVPYFSATGFSLKGKGYIGGGQIIKVQETGGYETLLEQFFWKYEPASDKWTQIADYPGKGMWDVVSGVANGKAFVGTGTVPTYIDTPGNTPPYNDFWQLNP